MRLAGILIRAGDVAVESGHVVTKLAGIFIEREGVVLALEHATVSAATPPPTTIGDALWSCMVTRGRVAVGALHAVRQKKRDQKVLSEFVQTSSW